MASEIEREIHAQLAAIGKVTIHMEEYHPAERQLENVTEAERLLANEIRAVTERHKEVFSCKDLTLLREGAQYTATLTCQIDRSKTLDEVHQIVSEIEAMLFQNFKQLRRIMIHAEPG
jgi:hypothetical protein